MESPDTFRLYLQALHENDNSNPDALTSAAQRRDELLTLPRPDPVPIKEPEPISASQEIAFDVMTGNSGAKLGRTQNSTSALSSSGLATEASDTASDGNPPAGSGAKGNPVHVIVEECKCLRSVSRDRDDQLYSL